jgi:hypothetical protein
LAFSAKQPAPGGFTVLRRRLARETSSDTRKLHDLKEELVDLPDRTDELVESTGLVT